MAGGGVEKGAALKFSGNFLLALSESQLIMFVETMLIHAQLLHKPEVAIYQGRVYSTSEGFWSCVRGAPDVTQSVGVATALEQDVVRGLL